MNALIINDPPSLNQALCLLGCSEPMDIAAQGRSEALQTMFERSEQGQSWPQQGLLHPLHSLHFPMMPLMCFDHL